MKEKGRILTSITLIIVLCSLVFGVWIVVKEVRVPTVTYPEKIALIRIEGTIGSSERFPFGGASSEEITRFLKRAREDPAIKAVVIRINSPGGYAAASQEIYREIMRLREVEKPVVVSMGDVAASGGYYVASAADKILAEPGTITGSIGAIITVPQFAEFFERLGIRFVIIKGGELKDIMSPFREITPEERELLQEMATEIHERFIEDVAKGRRLDVSKVREIADGRPLTGSQAKKLGLVDDFGNLNDAIDHAAKLADIERPTIIELKEKTIMEMLLELFTRQFTQQFMKIVRESIPTSPSTT